ncbi:MAG: histidinol dehydrogenase [Cyclobacteriaceae bacterium]
MQMVIRPPREVWELLAKRPTRDISKIEKIVRPILDKVKRNGDKALHKFIWEYDHVKIDEILVTPSELENAADNVDKDLRVAIQTAKENIEKFHRRQVTENFEIETMPGVLCSRKSVPIKSIGFYIPGGTAPLFSTVLMLAIPARIAGCKKIVLCTPTNSDGNINPVILYTAHMLGIKTVVKVGGAQAIAAMAYGTESVPRVDKIFGPGNQFVTVAKQLVSKDTVAIDMPAGPSELMVIAGNKSNPAFVAADLLSQTEHGVDSQVVLIASSETLIDRVQKEIGKQLESLPRKDIAIKALKNSRAILFDGKKESADFVNHYAPEHLTIATQHPEKIIDRVYNVGSVFIGDYTPESAGDYASGTNHTLPTNGWAKSIAGVSVDSFVKKITFQQISKDGLKKLGPVIEKMAAAEQLEAHKNAVSIRLKQILDEAD